MCVKESGGGEEWHGARGNLIWVCGWTYGAHVVRADSNQSCSNGMIRFCSTIFASSKAV